jgi:hypothetical protein
VLVNWGPVLEGKLLVLLAGNHAQQDQLQQQMLERL